MSGKYQHLKYFQKYFRRRKRTIRAAVCVMLTASSLGMLLPYLVSRRLLGIADASYAAVLQYSAVIMPVILFHQIFVYFWEKIVSVLTNLIAVDIRKDVVDRFAGTKYAEITRRTSGYYLERINDDVWEVSSFLPNILGISADCLTNFSFLAVIYLLNARCGAIFTAGILMMYLIESAKININIRSVETLKALGEKLSTKANENFRGIKDIKGLGIKEQIAGDTGAVIQKIAETQIRRDRQLALLSRCKTFTQHSVEAVLILYSAGSLIPTQALSAVALLTIVNYGGFMYDLVGYIAQIKDWFARGELKAERLLQAMDGAHMETFGRRDTLDAYDIAVRHLSYSYGGNGALLQDICFEVPEKSAAVFTGASGSGKTTLFGLLSGLLECNDNEIFIGGADINDLSETCLRDHLCVVHQEPFLLNDTVLRNIRIVKPSAALDEVYEACKRARIFDEINGLENGFHTVISENGGNLSGGQKQRISIARALLKNSSILLFDEPTSSLDKTNQDLFLQTVRELKEERTVLLIAHKLHDYTGFDRVFELGSGGGEGVKTLTLLK
ncbi:MAG: ABC transporter ATP-binding protein/permease [Clostridia bacterium]|nr:ABC transporter ATP-binding protein/permease [Clostridia bacterium]